MRIVAAITDSKRKSLMFMLDSLQVISLDDAIKYVKDEKIDGVHIVRGKNGKYIRTNRSLQRKNIDAMSVPLRWITASNATKSLFALRELKDFWEHYRAHLKERLKNGDVLIAVDADWPLATKEHVQKTLTPHKRHIFTAAKQYDIDPYLLGAILIDEIVRLAPLEDIWDNILSYVREETSVGVAQVSIETARDLIRLNLYNPNPNDPKLSKEKIAETSRLHLYKYASDGKHSIYFAAARIRQTIDYWGSFIDLTAKPEIIGTLYAQGLGKPKASPEPTDRGLQIAGEFHQMAKELLN